MKSQINIRASELLQRQLAELTDKLGTSITETVSIAIDRMHQQEIKNMSNIRYINISERYGECVETTLEDYRELNPEGTFEIDSSTDNIREYFSDNPGDWEVVAEPVTE